MQKASKITGARSPNGIVTNMLDCDIVVNEFELQTRYYIHFQTNTVKVSAPLSFQLWVKL